jgi:hypothetical protein
MAKKKKDRWLRLTNEFVFTFASKDCRNCEGHGYVGDEFHGFTVCSCAALEFRRQFVETGRVRQRQQLAQGGRMVTWQEYALLAPVDAETDVDADEVAAPDSSDTSVN